jgi:lipopolysaccharide/colanic/teichoic acid biosynthesis glycosyltransferase
MTLIIIPRSKSLTDGRSDLLRFAFSNEPIAGLILKDLGTGLTQSGISSLTWDRNKKVVCAIPEEWRLENLTAIPELIFYKENVPVNYISRQTTKRNAWSIFKNGRFSARINIKLLNKVLADTEADVLAVNAEPQLLAYFEKVRLTPQTKVAGFRRYYSDCIEPAPIPKDWPHYIFIRTGALEQILEDRTLPGSFSAFVQRCRSASLKLQATNIAGAALDLETENGLLNFCMVQLSKTRFSLRKDKTQNSSTICPGSRLIGKVLLGKNVFVGSNTIVIGPTIICDNAKIAKGAVVNTSIIGPNVCVPGHQDVNNSIIKGPRYDGKNIKRPASNFSRQINYRKFDSNRRKYANETFRTWPRLSYAGSFKRIIDCLAAIIVLILFLPLMPLIALAIKLNSPGPVFFKDKRQGLHGKEFYCLKFRSMTTGADKIQDKLRIVSQVDGPQFKVADDPRITAVGRFLRDTFIDEIPQFINVLLGQMSAIGPRPSPESENTLCPFWRDARLSVRPGITGLWQICRTRISGKDFQEWIHYDTEYIRNLSLKMDLWICWKTIKKLVKDFVSQF